MTLPSTTKEPTFESLVNAFESEVARQALTDFSSRSAHLIAARSALLDYVRKLEENALTAEEAQAFFRLESDPGDLSDREIAAARTASAKLRRISRSAPQLKDK